MTDYLAFERAYGQEMPPPLKALYENHKLVQVAPVCFVSPGKAFAAEIQHSKAIDDTVEKDVKAGRFCFAVNSDGCDMLVDLTAQDLPILQRENGETEYIGVTLMELLAATYREL